MINAPWLKDAKPETWMAYARHWRLPIQVFNRDMGGLVVKGVKGRTGEADPRSFLYLIRPHPELAYLKCWLEALKSHLDPRASAVDGNEWLYELDVIGLVAVPRLGETNMEKLVRWDPEQQWMVEEEAFIGAGDDDKEQALAMRQFLAGFVDRAGLCGFERFADLELFYHALAGYMRLCLLNDCVAPLGFCTLFASPLRANWQSVHLRDYAQRWKGFTRHARKGAFLAAERMQANFRQQKTQKMVARWRVEALMGQAWRRISLRQESEKARLLGEFGYIKQNQERLDRILPILEKAYRAWQADVRATPLSHALRDFKYVRISKKTGQIRRRNPGAAKGGRHPHSAAYHFVAGKNGPRKKPGQPPAVAGPDEGLREVPNL